MSRTRMIKPSFFKHAELYEAERESGLPLRIAFAGLWTVTDRAGRFRWKVDIKTDILPYDSVDMINVLETLERHGFVQSYLVAGKKYGFIPSFGDHQTFHHTERGSTLPAPLEHGGLTVILPADTVTVTVTTAVAGTQLTVVDDHASLAADLSHSPVTEPALTAIYLSIWANTAVTERWGEQPSPYTAAQCEASADLLRNKGVSWEVARASTYAQCRETKAAVPPRSPSYFRPGIEKAWDAELARRAVIASGEKPPPIAPPSGAGAKPVTGTRQEHWTDKRDREAREDGERRDAATKWGNVESRIHARLDGEAWWIRMKREAKSAGRNPVLYAYDRMNDPAEEPSHV